MSGRLTSLPSVRQLHLLMEPKNGKETREKLHCIAGGSRAVRGGGCCRGARADDARQERTAAGIDDGCHVRRGKLLRFCIVDINRHPVFFF